MKVDEDDSDYAPRRALMKKVSRLAIDKPEIELLVAHVATLPKSTLLLDIYQYENIVQEWVQGKYD